MPSAITCTPCAVSSIMSWIASNTFGIGERLDHVVFVAEQEMQRHHAGLRRDRRGVGGRDDGELDIARLDQLQHLRLLPELRAGILVDQHGALAQFLELQETVPPIL